MCPQTDPSIAQAFTQMQNPDQRQQVESKLAELKEDPELGPILAEIETGGPAAMMKCVCVHKALCVHVLCM